MNLLSIAERTKVISMLVEGCSIRAVSRVTGFSTNTITKLLVQIGEACRLYHDENVRGLNSKRVQCDEIWSFVGAKQRNVTEEQMAGGWGDAWTWTAIDADSKLVISYLVGQRGAAWANVFMKDVAARLTQVVQLTTDGHSAYLEAVKEAFGIYVSYAQLIKLYGQNTDLDRRYSTGECIGTQSVVRSGAPDPLHISTSYVERLNLTTRMQIRRFTRLTNAFSKKWENHEAAVALHFMHYNFCRVHKTLRVTPAIEAGIANHVWSVEDLVALMPEPVAKKRGPYKPRQKQ